MSNEGGDESGYGSDFDSGFAFNEERSFFARVPSESIDSYSIPSESIDFCPMRYVSVSSGVASRSVSDASRSSSARSRSDAAAFSTQCSGYSTQSSVFTDELPEGLNEEMLYGRPPPTENIDEVPVRNNTASECNEPVEDMETG